MQTVTLQAGPHKIRCRTQRRYVLIAHRDEPIVIEGDYTLVAFARIQKRSDSYTTLLAEIGRLRRNGHVARGCHLSIFDMNDAKKMV